MSFLFLTDKHRLHHKAASVRSRMMRLRIGTIAGTLTADDGQVGTLERGTLTVRHVSGGEATFRTTLGGAFIEAVLKRVMIEFANGAIAERDDGMTVTLVAFRIEATGCLECELNWLDGRIDRVLLGKKLPRTRPVSRERPPFRGPEGVDAKERGGLA